MILVNDVACMNPECPQRGTTGAGNVILVRTYGVDDIRFVKCRVCKTHFSERRGTPLFDVRLPKAKVIDVVKHLAEGNGVRQTSRLTGVGKDTVGRIAKEVGSHAKAIHDELVRDLDVPEVQMDEMWGFVGKKRQTSDRGGEGVRRAGEHLGSYGSRPTNQAGRLSGSRTIARSGNNRQVGRGLRGPDESRAARPCHHG